MTDENTGAPRSRYTHGYSHGVMQSHTWRTAENSAAYLLPHLAPGTTLLDVGCGPGTITLDLAARLGAGRVTGIDPEESVIARARGAAAKTDIDVHFAVANLFDWPRPDGGYGIVHAHQVLQHLPDPIAALAAMGALAAEDGIVAVRDADYGAMFWHPDVPELRHWQELYREVARGNGGEPDAARHLKAWAAAAGFAEITVVPEVWGFAMPAERTWWADLWAERTEHSGLAAGARERGLATDADLARIAAGWHVWAQESDAVFVVPHVALLCRGYHA